MSSVSRIIDFLRVMKIKPAAFYKVTGLSNGYLDKVKELGADKIERIISVYPSLDLTWLITGKGQMLNENSVKGINNVYDFETPAAAGSAIILNGIDETKATPNLYLPGLMHGTYIRVPVKGDSMYSTIKDGDKALCVLLHNPKEDLRSGYIYTVIDEEDGLVTKRLYKEGKENVEFVSDNELYLPYKRKYSSLIAIFKVVEVHTTDLHNYCNDIRRDVRELQKKVQEISDKVE